MSSSAIKPNPAIMQARPLAANLDSPISALDCRKHAVQLIVGGRPTKIEYRGETIELPCVMDMHQLPQSVASKFAHDFTKLINRYMTNTFTCVHSGTVCTQMKLIAHDKKMPVAVEAPNPCANRMCPFFMPKDPGSILMEIVQSDLLVKLISYGVCGDEMDVEFFRDNMTFPQLAFALEQIYHQNYNPTHTLPEESAKNVVGLLAALGMGLAQSTPDLQTPSEMPEIVTSPEDQIEN